MTAQLQDTSVLQAELVRQLAHKLTSTIGAMLGFGELLGDPGLCEDPDFLGHSRAVFLKEGRFSLQILNDAQLAATLLAGNVPMEEKRVPILPAIQTIVAEIQKEHARQVVVSSTRKNAAIVGDVYWFSLGIKRLVENGLKFSPPNTPVLLSIKEEASSGWGEISVTDYGPGIEPRTPEQLFAPLAPVRKPVDPSFPTGLGVGLYIAHQIITLHHGHLSYRSAPDKGSIFSASLPFVQS